MEYFDNRCYHHVLFQLNSLNLRNQKQVCLQNDHHFDSLIGFAEFNKVVILFSQELAIIIKNLSNRLEDFYSNDQFGCKIVLDSQRSAIVTIAGH